jgi:hypothetical protein
MATELQARDLALRAATKLGEDFTKALLAQHLRPEHGPLLIQCGHFSLMYDRRTSKLVPAVPSELVESIEPKGVDVSVAGGIFPSFTWDLGNSIAHALQGAGFFCSLTTVVNDWQLVKGVPPAIAARLRRDFYDNTIFPLASYSRETDGNTHHVGFMSEYSLRRRLERRVKRLVSTQSIKRLFWRDRGNGSPGSLCLNGDNGEQLILRDGRSDCAGEISELIFIANGLGYPTLINIYPIGCLEPVHQGALLAFELEKVALQSSIVIQIGLSSSGETSAEELLSKEIRATVQTSDGCTLPLR